jgi:uncharacterized protein (DUF3084 family)
LETGDADMTPRLILAVAWSATVLALGTPALAQVGNDDAIRAQSAIMSAGTRAGRVTAIDGVPSLGVVRLYVRIGSQLRSELPDPQEYRILAAKNASGVNRLRRALRANPATREALAERGIGINRIVGADVGSDGALRVYLVK